MRVPNGCLLCNERHGPRAGRRHCRSGGLGALSPGPAHLPPHGRGGRGQPFFEPHSAGARTYICHIWYDRRCGGETPQGGGVWEGGFIGRALSQFSLSPPYIHCGHTVAHRRPPGGTMCLYVCVCVCVGVKTTFFRKARKKYPELPILTNVDVKPFFRLET